MQPPVSILILAAGLGTRMRSKQAKVLHQAGGKPLVAHVVDSALEVTGPERVFVVVGHQADAVEASLRERGVGFIRQTEQLGTGHAVAMGRDRLESQGGRLMVLYGDCPLLSAGTLRRLIGLHDQSRAAATVITTQLEDPTGYGRVLRDESGAVRAIVEQKAGTPEELAVKEINSGIYCFESELLWRHLGEIKTDNPAGEYYLTDMVAILRRAGHPVQPFLLEDPSEVLGINTRVELAVVDRIFRERKVRELMLAGVTIEKPETVSIDSQVEIGMDSIVEPFTRILGRTRIGQDCRVGAHAIIQDSTLADGVQVGPYTIIGTSVVEAGAHVGPFARLRLENTVGAGAHIGNFVELKKTELGAGAKASHLAYLGDSSIGAGSNIGAGTITCNYDGKKKHRTQIGEGAFIGSNSTLVAPVEIGPGSYVGAGSVITEPVPPDALALGRGRQVNKAGWVKKRT